MTMNIETSNCQLTQAQFEAEISQLTLEIEMAAELSAYPVQQRQRILSRLQETLEDSRRFERETGHCDAFSDPALQEKIQQREQSGPRAENIRAQYNLPLGEISTLDRLTLDEFVNAKMLTEQKGRLGSSTKSSTASDKASS